MLAVSSKHGVVDACHQWSRLWERLRHGDAKLFKLAGGIMKVELIEHAMVPVACDFAPILPLESLSLFEKPLEVGPLGDFFCTEQFHFRQVDVGIAHQQFLG